MEKRLSWSIVKEHFSDQWIELADYRWDWEAPHPTWVVLGSHASERSELLSLIAGRSLEQDEATNTESTPKETSPRAKTTDLHQSPSLPTEPVILFVGATHTVPTPLSASV